VNAQGRASPDQRPLSAGLEPAQAPAHPAKPATPATPATAVTPSQAEGPAGQQSALPEERLIGVIPYAVYFEDVVSLLFTDRRVIMANPLDVSGLSARSVGRTADALRMAATLGFGVAGFAAGTLVSYPAKRKAWSDLKKKLKEQGLPPVAWISRSRASRERASSTRA